MLTPDIINPKIILPTSRYIIGLDLGRIADPSAYVVLCGNTVVHTKLRPLGERHESGAEYAKTLKRKFNNAKIIVDTTGGATGGKMKADEILKFYRKSIPSMFECNWAGERKKDMIEGLSLAIEQGKICIPSEHEKLHQQLSLYEFTMKKNGYRIEYGAPRGQHDDLVSALAMAWYSKRWGNREGFGPLPGGL